MFGYGSKELMGRSRDQSAKLLGRGDRLGTELIQLPTGMLTPEVAPINDRYFIWCSGPLKVKGSNLGQISLKILLVIISCWWP